MFDENQLVAVKWSSRTKSHYIEQGYTFTKCGDTFNVVAKDLPKGSNKKVVVVCDYCGRECLVSFCNYNKRKNQTLDSCSHCKTQKQWDSTLVDRAKEKFGKIQDVCDANGYTLITKESEYSGVFMKIKYICPKHGVQTTTIDSFLHGHKCFVCSYVERGEDQRFSCERVKQIIESRNDNVLLNPEQYINVFEKNLNIKCGSCGDVYTTNLDSYVHKTQIRCSHCSQKESIGELRIRCFLEEHDISFEQEKRFDDCRNPKTDIMLPFDFYLPDKNLIIEFDGQHHYFETFSKQNHEGTVAHDKIKNKYCKSHNINLIRIPYWDGNDIENILANELDL